MPALLLAAIRDEVDKQAAQTGELAKNPSTYNISI
jgi:hypothetical protein